MIFAIQLVSDISGIGETEDQNTTRTFCIVSPGGGEEVLSVDATVKKDVARTLIARDVQVLVARNLSLESFILLKSYGIRVYAAPEAPMSVSETMAAFEEEKLSEITSRDFTQPANNHDHSSESFAAADTFIPRERA